MNNNLRKCYLFRQNYLPSSDAPSTIRSGNQVKGSSPLEEDDDFD